MLRGKKRGRPEVVYVDRGGDASVKWLLWGALLGAGVALLYAPRSGEETRRALQRRLWKLRAMTEEKLDELTQQFGGAGGGDGDRDFEEDEEFDEAIEPAGRAPSAREELERRLAQARARRRVGSERSGSERGNSDEYEEPLA